MQHQAPLVEVLSHYLSDRHLPFYFPGHKRGGATDWELVELLGKNIFSLDLPELPGLAEKIAHAQTLAAQAYGAEQTWFLTNGSTIGIHAMILATCKPGQKVLIGRNCHRATIGGLILSGAVPVYLATDAEAGIDLGVSALTLEQGLKAHPDANVVLLVSPNYFGVCGAVQEWVKICHDRDVTLLIDSAHGAHLGFHPGLPTSPLQLGADLVVQSTHKTATALTQSSMLHLQGGRVGGAEVETALGILQSTSQSLILLASLDGSRRQIALEGKDLLDRLLVMCREFCGLVPDGFKVFIPDDPTRITITPPLGTGFDLDQWLCNYPQHPIVAELPTYDHLVFAFGLGNMTSDADRLLRALKSFPDGQVISPKIPIGLPPQAVAPPICSPRDAYFAPGKYVEFSESIGKISRSIVCPYPPGIPLFFPGEEITTESIAYLQLVNRSGGILQGCTAQGTIDVIA